MGLHSAAVGLMAVAMAIVTVPWPSNELRVGIKPWVGFSPLAVAAELDLCEGTDVVLVPVSGIEVGGQQVVGARQSAILNPSGGTIIDAEARQVIGQITAALMSHGLIG